MSMATPSTILLELNRQRRRRPRLELQCPVHNRQFSIFISPLSSCGPWTLYSLFDLEKRKIVSTNTTEEEQRSRDWNEDTHGVSSMIIITHLGVSPDWVLNLFNFLLYYTLDLGTRTSQNTSVTLTRLGALTRTRRCRGLSIVGTISFIMKWRYQV